MITSSSNSILIIELNQLSYNIIICFDRQCFSR